MGSLVCHQIPQRTIYINELPLPVCARDTGIYTGIFVSFAFILLKGRWNSDMPPRPAISIFLTLLMVPMMIDGVSSYLQLRETDNVLRLITGLLFGMPIPVFLVPAANFKIYEKNNRVVVRSLFEVVSLLVISILVALLLYNRLLPWFLVSAALVTALIFIIGRFVFTIFKRMGLLKGRLWFLPVVAVTLIVFSLMYAVSNYLH